MIKRFLFSLLFLTTVVATNAQTVIEAKQIKAVDSLKLKTDWITNIIKDSSLTGATVRNFPSTDAVIKYIANRLAYTVKYSDTAGLIAGYVRETRFLDSLTAIQTRIQGKLTKADADTYYPAIQRVMDSLTNVQERIQGKLTKSDADGFYPATQRMIDSLVALQQRIQGKLTKADADTYYPAIQPMIDSLAALQNRLQTKEPLLGFTPVPNTRTINGYALTGNITITKSDVSLGNVDNTSDANKPISTATQTALDGKQNTIGYTPENVANKATDFTTVNNTLYPTVQAVVTHTQSALTGVLKDRGNYNASGNVFPSSGGSGSGGAIQQGNMWYISVGGTLGGTTVYAGDWVRALVDAPGQTSSNWAIAGGSFGFTPENSANKSTNTSLGTSNTLYPTQNAVKVYVDAAVTNGNTAYSWGNHAGLYPTNNGTGATGTWGISISGNAATATDATRWGSSLANFSISMAGNDANGVPAFNVANGRFEYLTMPNLQAALGLGSNAYTSTAYLPLTGGTLTGALAGTSGTYSGNLKTGTYLSIGTQNSPLYSEQLTIGVFNIPKITYAQTGGYRWSTFVDNSGDAKFRIRYEEGSIDPFVIDRLGNVGFGNTSPSYKTVVSPVTQYTAINTGDGFQLDGSVIGTSANLIFGINTSGNIIQSRASTSSYPLLLNPFGAPVLINTTTNNGVDILQVNGSVSTGDIKWTGQLYNQQDGSNSVQGKLTLFNAAATSAFNFQLNGSGTELHLWNLTSGTWSDRITFTNAGAAAFSSTVQSTGFLTVSGSNSAYWLKSNARLMASDNLSLLDIGASTSGHTIQSNFYGGGAYYSITLSANPASYPSQFVLNTNGTVNFVSTVTASSFSGAGTGLTGTASSLTVGNSTQWNGYTLNTSSIQESASIDAVFAKPTGASSGLFVGQTGLRTFLGLGSAAYTASSAYEVPLTFSTGLNRSGNTITNTGVTSITGTTNQVIASASTGGITLSLPQSIATTSNVTFADIISNTLKQGSGSVYSVGTIILSAQPTGSPQQVLPITVAGTTYYIALYPNYMLL